MYTQKKPIENVHIVRERDRKRFRELLAVVSLGVPIGAFLLLFTWQNLEVIRLGHEATRLQQQRKQISDANKALQLELDRRTSLAEVEKKAAALGFETTEPQAIVMVEERSLAPLAGRGWREAPGEGSPSSALRAPSPLAEGRRPSVAEEQRP
ncbi:MAG TPA: hypothetical protein VJ276_10690 [Thermoanaerobaculia bacterium]|nr:hypothetical protein [Thermoanaerobaculia bacterium]